MKNLIKASPKDRFWAMMIDILVAGIPAFLLGLLGYRWAAFGKVIFMGYMYTKDALPVLQGQSIGKKAMAIKVVSNESGEDITNKFGMSILRQLILWIPFLGLVDAITVYADDRRRLGDRLGGTMVVNVIS